MIANMQQPQPAPYRVEQEAAAILAAAPAAEAPPILHGAYLIAAAYIIAGRSQPDPDGAVQYALLIAAAYEAATGQAPPVWPTAPPMPGQPPSPARPAPVMTHEAQHIAAPAGAAWRLKSFRHLPGQENQRRHNAYIYVFRDGRRARDPSLRIGFTWQGRDTANEPAPPVPLDKPDGEPHGNLPIFQGQIVKLWIEGAGQSDAVANLHTSPPGPPEEGNGPGHHSYELIFEYDPGAPIAYGTEAPPAAAGQAGAQEGA